MQADGLFYCYTCSFQTGARPGCLEPEAQVELAGVTAQLRHAYQNLVAHENRWSRRGMQEFADGLIAPQIRKLERIMRRGQADPPVPHEAQTTTEKRSKGDEI